MADNFKTYKTLISTLRTALNKTKKSNDAVIESSINAVYLTEINEADDLHALFWLKKTDESQICVGPSVISGITLAAPGVITTTEAHNLLDGFIVSLFDIFGTTELNDRTFRVSVVNATSVQLKDLQGNDFDTSSMTAWTSGGSVLHRGLTLTQPIKRILKAEWINENIMKEVQPGFQFFDNVSSTPSEYYTEKTFDKVGVETFQIFWDSGASQKHRLRFVYEEQCDRLSDDDDVPKLPFQFHDVIVSGVMARLAENDVQVENAVIWPTIYQLELAGIVQYNRKNLIEDDETPFMI